MSSEKSRHITFYILLGLATLLFIYLMKPFFFPIFWAAVIATIFMPAHQYFCRKVKSRSLSATIVLLMIMLIIILPAGVIGSLLLNESLALYNALDVSSASIEQQLQNFSGKITANPYLSRMHIDTAFLTANLAEGAKNIANYIIYNLRDLTQNTIVFAVNFSIMLYTLFFFIRDGDKFVRMIMKLLPLDEAREILILERFSSTARATLKVTLIIGGIQGILGGLIFFLTGVKGALTWGTMMVFTSIVPAIGCSLVWAPAGIVMAMMGHFWEGMIILAFGIIVISHVDAVLRPLLLGHDVQMHTLLIFLSTLGGLALFGISGFVIGPVITSLMQAFWQMHDELSKSKKS
ncbi:MAG: AI-2E family transporter [Syntrophales bacterium]|jgi:predicted PurR-regulated permease PerM